MKMPSDDQIQYSEKYCDDHYEYRHVILPVELARNVPKSHLMTETEWRNMGVQQSPDWVHYMMHSPEPHVLLFRRPRTDVPPPTTQQGQYPYSRGQCDQETQKEICNVPTIDGTSFIVSDSLITLCFIRFITNKNKMCD